MPFAAGAVVVPTLAPGEPVELVVALDRKMPGSGKYDVSLLPTAPLLSAHAQVTVAAQSPTDVTVRVVVEQGLAGAGTVFVICN